jgi:hypothetical protein
MALLDPAQGRTGGRIPTFLEAGFGAGLVLMDVEAAEAIEARP